MLQLGGCADLLEERKWHCFTKRRACDVTASNLSPTAHRTITQILQLSSWISKRITTDNTNLHCQYRPRQMICARHVFRCFKWLERIGDKVTGAAGPFFVGFAVLLLSTGIICFCEFPVSRTATHAAVLTRRHS